jgi:hypothetical protein
VALQQERDILLKNKAEVTRMLLTEFDEKEYIATQRREGMAEGRAEASAQVSRLCAYLLQNGKMDELEKKR